MVKFYFIVKFIGFELNVFYVSWLLVMYVKKNWY